MAKKPHYDLWWCIRSPQYGLLPFTAHTLRRGAIGLFETHGMAPLERAQRLHMRGGFMKKWRESKREGFQCVRICVRPTSTRTTVR